MNPNTVTIHIGALPVWLTRSVVARSAGRRPGHATRARSAASAEKVCSIAVRDRQVDSFARGGQQRPPLLGGDLPARIDMPVDGGAMQPVAVDEVGDDQQIAVQREHMAPVDERPVAVVRGLEVVEAVVRPPACARAVARRAIQWNGPLGIDCGRSSTTRVLCARSTACGRAASASIV